MIPSRPQVAMSAEPPAWLAVLEKRMPATATETDRQAGGNRARRSAKQQSLTARAFFDGHAQKNARQTGSRLHVCHSPLAILQLHSLWRPPTPS
jgi:hypothetical protein